VATTAVPIAQAALAAGLSWLVAVHIVDHRAPFFAPVAAVVCLGITLGQRLRRVIELIVGVGLGVGVGDVLISAIGTGPWQIALVVALAMSIAVLLDGGAVITVQSAVSAILMVTLYLPGRRAAQPTGRWTDRRRNRARRRRRVSAKRVSGSVVVTGIELETRRRKAAKEGTKTMNWLINAVTHEDPR
jgi:hypothetical protein